MTREKLLLAAALEHLHSQGWQTWSPVVYDHFKIDATGFRHGKYAIVEAKAKSNFVTIAHGLGQLLAYREASTIGPVHLFLVLPEHPNFVEKSILQRFGVEVLVVKSLTSS